MPTSSPSTATMAALGRLHLPEPALYVLIGAAGAGKTAITAAFPPAWRLSLDDCRAQVSGCAGDQDASVDALRVFDVVLAGRLARRLPTVVDATSTHHPHRICLVDRARAHRVPAVALVVRTPLTVCQARQDTRPPARQVPADVIARQHQNIPTAEALIKEGFAQVHDTAGLDLLRMLLEHAAAASPDGLRAEFRVAFGDDLAAAVSSHPVPGHLLLAVAGRELLLRYNDGGDPFDHGWEARLQESCPDGCGGGALWTRVTDPGDLLAVHLGGDPDEARCDTCDPFDTAPAHRPGRATASSSSPGGTW
ncbi:AAA family ATPase [Streptomyces sp. NPDC014894]|uniref:AAA family ATPase n=1 Tax=Streptomyces sp. NPDC014894 TaxID=3364931 RepID=UPI003700863B